MAGGQADTVKFMWGNIVNSVIRAVGLSFAVL